jgi:hypothetical protein
MNRFIAAEALALTALAACILLACAPADAGIVEVPLELPPGGLAFESTAQEIAFDAGQLLPRIRSVQLAITGQHWSCGRYWCSGSMPYEFTCGPAALQIAVLQGGLPLADATLALPWIDTSPGYWMDLDLSCRLMADDWSLLESGAGVVSLTPVGVGDPLEICDPDGWFALIRVLVTDAQLIVVMGPVSGEPTTWGAIKAVYR